MGRLRAAVSRSSRCGAAARTTSARSPSACTSSLGRTSFEHRIPTRWPDFDALGHLNHAAYHVFLDEARDDALRRTIGDFDAFPNVIAHVSIDYRREIERGAREVLVLTRIARAGTSSVTFEQSVLAPDGSIAAEATAVLVAWDPAERRSRPLTDAERRALAAEPA